MCNIPASYASTGGFRRLAWVTMVGYFGRGYHGEETRSIICTGSYVQFINIVIIIRIVDSAYRGVLPRKLWTDGFLDRNTSDGDALASLACTEALTATMTGDAFDDDDFVSICIDFSGDFMDNPLCVESPTTTCLYDLFDDDAADLEFAVSLFSIGCLLAMVCRLYVALWYQKVMRRWSSNVASAICN